MDNTPGKGKRPILFVILVPLLLLILAEVLLFLGILSVSGIVDRLNQNDCDTLDMRVSGRKDQLQEQLQEIGTGTGTLAQELGRTASELAARGNMDFRSIDQESDSSEFLEAAVAPLVSMLRSCDATGAFVVLNTSDLSTQHNTGDYGTKPCIYLSDSSPSDTPSSRNDDLVFEIAPSEVVQANTIATSRSWTPTRRFDERVYPQEHDFLYVPYQAAADAQETPHPAEYAYWSISAPHDNDNGQLCLTCSMPLVIDDGTVCGVVGADISAERLAALLPYAELIDQDEGSYLLASANASQLAQPTGEPTQTSPAVYTGFRPVENTEYGRLFTIVRGSTSDSSYHTSNGQYYVSCEPLALYNATTPFEHDEWVLLGIMPQSTLHSFSQQAVGMVGVATLFMLLLGFAGSLLLGHGIANPLRNLSKEVAQAEMEGSETIQLSSTGIEEVDQLTSAISTLSSNVASARRLEQERLKYERDYDLLTGLMNRRAFYRRGNEIFADPKLVENAAVVMLDLDNLKTINDAYGHDCGDKYIRQAAQCFKSAVPNHVLVARVSGDEFFLLFYGYDSREQVNADIEKLRQAIPRTEMELPDGTVAHVNASGGAALYLQDSTEFSELMKLADFTMYQVKESGKNNIAYFDFETYQKKSSALRAEAEFDDLMDDFSLATYHFQPIFDAHTGKVFAYEALMRVSLGLLHSPADVLELARKQDRLEEVERMTWTRSLECYEDLQDAGQVSDEALLFINSFANLSLDEEELAAISQRHEQTMGKVVIEVTEMVDMDERATAIKRGIPGFSGHFALDDYGSGYNSELKLLALHPKFVKVDISIINNINTSADRQRIVSHVVEYAHERDMLIVGEGVETADELDTLITLGVDLVQGYYLARPAKVPEALNGEAAQHMAPQEA